MSESESQYGPFIAVKWGGRSSGVLHVDRNCRFIDDKEDEDLVWGPRNRFDPDQQVCRNCGGDSS